MAATVALPERLRFITGNPGKASEMRSLLAPLGIEVDQDARGYPELQADDLQTVAQEGARALLAGGVGPPFVLEDSGLFVTALAGFPGVYSRHALDTLGCQGLLKLMVDLEEEMRGATFEAHLVYVDPGGELHGFTGRCRGRIAHRMAGRGGFGFDPVFVPEDPSAAGRTFAQLDADEKDALSHRAAAAKAFAAWLMKQEKE